METVEEQMEYGDHCVHGTNVGTPGGADLMCQLCELGLTEWVEDPLLELQVKIHYTTENVEKDIPWSASRVYPLRIRMSTLLEEFDDTVDKLVQEMARFEDMVCAHERVKADPKWRLHPVEKGYWDEPQG